MEGQSKKSNEKRKPVSRRIIGRVKKVARLMDN